MTDLEELRDLISQFNKDRDWDQFHDGKNLAIGLSVEASELLEPFLWKNAEEVPVEKIREELADVVIFAIQMADKYNLDIRQIVLDKVAKNAMKYPVEKAKGVATKYTEL